MFLLPYNLNVNGFISVKVYCFIVARYEGILCVSHPNSSDSAVQFTVEKSEFKWLVTTDQKCFCSTTSQKM